MGNKKFKVVRQHDASDCGAAVLSSICNYYNNEIPISTIRSIVGTDTTGTTVQGLVDGAQELGYDVKPIRIDKDDVATDYTLPAIAHIITEHGLPHYVVIYSIRGDKIIVGDPARGTYTSTIDEFNAVFSGILILLLPNSNFTMSDSEKIGVYNIFKKLILPQRKLLITLIVVSLFLSLVAIAASFFSKIIFDEIVPYKLKTSLYVYAVVFFIINLMQIFLTFFKEQVLLFLSRKIDIPIILGYFNHILRLPFDFFATRKVGDVLTRFQDAMVVKQIFTSVSISLVIDISLSVVTAIVLMQLNVILFAILLGIVIVNIGLVYIFKKRYAILNYEQMEAQAILNSHLIESVKNIETIKIFNAESELIEDLEYKTVRKMQIDYKEGLTRNIQSTISSFFQTMGNMVFLVVGALSIIDNKMSLGDFLVFQSLSTYFTQPVQSLVSLQLTFQEAQIAMERLKEIMNVQQEVEKEKRFIETFDLKGELQFTDVEFQYGSRSMVFENFNLRIPHGKKVAIVGESGAGKSTLSKLLLGFYYVSKGKVIMNGYNVKDLHPEKLRQKIGYVSQNIEFFSGTLYENLTLGNKHVTFEDVVEATKKAGCHEFIERLPARYYTYVEEGGTNFSGGERQRIAIARSLLKKADIYIFDEATSNLDSKSEHVIHEMMFKSTEGKTTIMIAHRLSTIINADYIFFLKQGRVVEEGTHNQLIAKKGHYFSMIQLQYGSLSGDYSAEREHTNQKEFVQQHYNGSNLLQQRTEEVEEITYG